MRHRRRGHCGRCDRERTDCACGRHCAECGERIKWAVRDKRVGSLRWKSGDPRHDLCHRCFTSVRDEAAAMRLPPAERRHKQAITRLLSQFAIWIGPAPTLATLASQDLSPTAMWGPENHSVPVESPPKTDELPVLRESALAA